MGYTCSAFSFTLAGSFLPPILLARHHWFKLTLFLEKSCFEPYQSHVRFLQSSSLNGSLHYLTAFGESQEHVLSVPVRPEVSMALKTRLAGVLGSGTEQSREGCLLLPGPPFMTALSCSLLSVPPMHKPLPVSYFCSCYSLHSQLNSTLLCWLQQCIPQIILCKEGFL